MHPEKIFFVSSSPDQFLSAMPKDGGGAPATVTPSPREERSTDDAEEMEWLIKAGLDLISPQSPCTARRRRHSLGEACYHNDNDDDDDDDDAQSLDESKLQMSVDRKGLGRAIMTKEEEDARAWLPTSPSRLFDGSGRMSSMQVLEDIQNELALEFGMTSNSSSSSQSLEIPTIVPCLRRRNSSDKIPKIKKRVSFQLDLPQQQEEEEEEGEDHEDDDESFFSTWFPPESFSPKSISDTNVTTSPPPPFQVYSAVQQQQQQGEEKTTPKEEPSDADTVVSYEPNEPPTPVVTNEDELNAHGSNHSQDSSVKRPMVSPLVKYLQTTSVTTTRGPEASTATATTSSLSSVSTPSESARSSRRRRTSTEKKKRNDDDSNATLLVDNRTSRKTTTTTPKNNINTVRLANLKSNFERLHQQVQQQQRQLLGDHEKQPFKPRRYKRSVQARTTTNGKSSPSKFAVATEAAAMAKAEDLATAWSSPPLNARVSPHKVISTRSTSPPRLHRHSSDNHAASRRGTPPKKGATRRSSDPTRPQKGRKGIFVATPKDKRRRGRVEAPTKQTETTKRKKSKNRNVLTGRRTRSTGAISDEVEQHLQTAFHHLGRRDTVGAPKAEKTSTTTTLQMLQLAVEETSGSAMQDVRTEMRGMRMRWERDNGHKSSRRTQSDEMLSSSPRRDDKRRARRQQRLLQE